jgi:hypothetical protein
MSQPADPMQTSSQEAWGCLSQDPMQVDEVRGKKLRSHVIFSHGLAVNKSSHHSTPVTTINLRVSYPNVIVIMNCHPIPQKMPCNLATLWGVLNTFQGDIKTIAELMINLNDIYFAEHKSTKEAGLCYFFDRCPNIYLSPELKRWRDGIFELPQHQFNKENANYRVPVENDINNLRHFGDLASYIDYLHCKDRQNLHIVIVFACTNPVEEGEGQLSYDNPKLKYCRSFPVKDTRSSEVLNAIYTKWFTVQGGGKSKEHIYLLGRNRRIYKNNKRLYVRYKNNLITLKKALNIEKNLESKKL